MKSAFQRYKKIVLRTSVYGFLLACSQPVMETYGCACASRSYVKGEVDRYRAGAARNEPHALAEMQEYYEWRSWEYPDKSPENLREAKIARSYFDRRLALNDQDALDDEVSSLIFDAAFEPMTPSEREKALVKAQAYAKKQTIELTTIDLFDPERHMIDTQTYIDRELRYMQERGNGYLQSRRRDEDLAEQRLKRSTSS